MVVPAASSSRFCLSSTHLSTCEKYTLKVPVWNPCAELPSKQADGYQYQHR
jgi:hypothetical protein